MKKFKVLQRKFQKGLKSKFFKQPKVTKDNRPSKLPPNKLIIIKHKCTSAKLRKSYEPLKQTDIKKYLKSHIRVGISHHFTGKNCIREKGFKQVTVSEMWNTAPEKQFKKAAKAPPLPYIP